MKDLRVEIQAIRQQTAAVYASLKLSQDTDRMRQHLLNAETELGHAEGIVRRPTRRPK